jgi:Interferon-induced transmembrane protein
MFCRNCGAQVEGLATTCPRCGAVVPENAPTEQVPNYLVQAILVTIFCCLPFGIPAIVYAAQVNSKLAGGDYAGALDASGKAKTWCWVGFLCGLIPTLLYLVMMIIAIAADANNNFGR